MHRLYRFFFLLLLPVTLLAIGGCGRGTAPGYDSLRGDILADLADALAADDGEKLEKSLARLEKLTEVTDFITELREKENTRKLVTELNRAYANGDTAGAQKILAAYRDLVSAQAELLILPKEVDALRKMDLYLQHAPYATAADMGAALQDIQSSARFLADAPTFTRWLQAEMQALAKLQRQERDKQIGAVLETCDREVVEEAISREVTIAQLLALAPDAAFAVFFKALRDGKTEAVLTRLEQPDSMTNRDWQSFEVALLANRRRFAADEFTRLTSALSARPPQTHCGYILKIHHAGTAGKPATALNWLRRYIDQGGQLSASLSDELIPLIVLPPEQFNARPWRLAYPAADHLLGRYVQWLNTHQGTGE